MRKVIIAMILVLNFTQAGIIDKFYVFVENKQNKDKTDNKKTNEFLFKTLIEKTNEYGENSFSKISITSNISHDIEGENTESKIDVKKLYYDITRYAGIVNLRIGRDIKNFDYGNTYSIINYLSPSGSMGDPSDRTLKIKAMDGFSLTLTDPDDNKGVDSTATVHIYAKDITNENGQKEQSHLIELTQVGDKYNQTIFIANETKKHPSLAIARTKTIGDSINFTTVSKYEHNENDFGKRWSFLLNLEYSPISDSLIGLEYIHLGNGLEGKKERSKKHTSFRSAQEFKDFYKTLTSNQYISLYTKIDFDNFTTMLSTLENLSDASRRINLQATYDINNISLHSSITAHNSDNENSEFGYLKKNAFEYEYKFFLSYLWLD